VRVVFLRMFAIGTAQICKSFALRSSLLVCLGGEWLSAAHVITVYKS
jgi:hypothetical protein